MCDRTNRSLLLASIVSIGLAGCTGKPSPNKPNATTAPQGVEAETASAETASDPADRMGATVQKPQGKPSITIVTLKGREHTITIYSAPDGPRFTVATVDGKVMADQLSADEMRQQHPGIYKTYKSSFAGSDAHLDASARPLDASR